ncbi:MAG: imidazole glycerol phosphate synthase subunit HisH [Rhodospirillales bacterium]
MIGIIDYGLGNLTSVAGAVEKVGFEPVVSADAGVLSECEKLILPGVGAFGDGMRNLRDRDLVGPLTDLVTKAGRPILGICLGFQLLAKRSEEFGDHEGLGWIDARVAALKPDDTALRLPHVGWNELYQSADCVLFDDIPDESLFYYVHSYALEPENGALVAGECDYGGRFAAAVQSGSIFGTQFHPEKSQLHGLTLLRNFLEKS